MTARANCEPEQIYTQYGPNSKNSPMWWDGYEGQKRVIMDDFRPWWCPFSFLLALLDQYQMQVQIKGGFANFVPEEIIITTTKKPEDLFSGEYRTPEDIAQLRRRLDHVTQFLRFPVGDSNSHYPPAWQGPSTSTAINVGDQCSCREVPSLTPTFQYDARALPNVYDMSEEPL